MAVSKRECNFARRKNNFMKLKYKVLFLVLLIGISASAQKNHKSFKIESSTKIEQLKYNLGKDFGGRYSKSMSCYWNDTLYLCMIDYDCFENLTLFMYDVKTASYSCCNIDMKPICRSFRGNPYMIEHFATNGKDLVLCDVNDDECLWVFKKQGDTFVFDCKIPDPDYLFGKSMRFLPNGKLLGLKNYAYSRDNNPTKLSLLDMESKSVTKTINVDFPLIGFTFMSPYENLSVSDSSIMLSQRGEYKISEYDFDLNKKGDLTTTPEGWKQMPTNLSDSLMNSNPHLANKCAAFMNASEDYSQIQYISADENTLMVFYKQRTKDEYLYYDVWNRENGSWKLQYRNICDKTNSLRHLSERSLFYFQANYTHLYIIGERILRVRMDIPDLGRHIKSVYMNKLQEHLLNNDLSFVVDVLKFD